MADKPTSVSKFKAKISDLNGRFKNRHKVSRENIKVFHYGNGNHKYTKNEIEYVASQMSQKLGHNYKLQINAQFGAEWKTGQLTDGSHNIPIWDPTHNYAADNAQTFTFNKYKNDIKRFNIVVLYKGQPEGGKGKHNDCMYDCIDAALGGREYNPWKKPSRLKKFLKIERDDFIEIDHIPKIEDKIKAQINVEGDYIYQSTKTQFTRVINITLLKEHYTLNKKKSQKIVTGISIKERKIIFPCGFLPEGERFYNGKEYITLTFEEIKEIRRKPMSAEYIIVRGAHKDVENEYREYIEAVEEIKKETNGVINFYKTGSVKATALKLFQDLNVSTPQPEPISQMEAQFINGCPNYGLMYHKEYKGEGYMYDVKTFYGSIQRSSMQLPHKAGEFKKITQDEFNAYKFKPFGIYHCQIIGDHDYFMKSSKNYYTSTSVINALELGLEVRMIIDKEPNLIEYVQEKRIQASVLFKKYVDFLFPLKQKGLKLAKQLIVYGWGSLCENRIEKEHIVNLDKDDVKILEDDEMISDVSTLRDNIFKVTTIKPDNMFMTNYARVKAFLTAKGQVIMSKSMLPYKDKIVRAHTDGIISTCPLDFKLGSYIGDMVFEGYNKMVYVNSLNDIEITCDCGEVINKNDKEHKKTHKST